MPVARCVVTLNRTTGVAADQITNTWYFATTPTTGTLDSGDCSDLSDAVGLVYQAIDNSFMTNFITTTANTEFFDMNDPEPRVPVHDDTFTLSSLVSSSQLPCDVAAVLSFQAPTQSGVNQRRRRGRIYIGPLTSGIYTAGTGDVEINSGFRSAVETGINAMQTAAAAITPAFFHAVYSPTQFASTGDMEESIALVTEYSIDNQTDTQRRRGKTQQVRTILTT